MKVYQLYCILVLLLCSLVIQAQPAAVFHGGIAKLTNQDKLITPEGASHPGFMIGLDAMLSRKGINLMAGFQYHQFHFVATENSAFFSMDDYVSYTKLRFGMNGGFEIREGMGLRIYALASVPLLTNLPRTDEDIPQRSLNDAYLAAVGGASFILGPGIISLEYEKGLSDVTPLLTATRNNSLALSLGFIF